MTPTERHASGGEPLDRAARDSIRLAHQALDRFPELVRKHKFIAGGAAISSSLIVLAGVAIAHRIKAGQTPEEAVASVTEDEMQGLRVVETESEVEEPEPADLEEAAATGELEQARSGMPLPSSSTESESAAPIYHVNGAS